MGLDIKYGVWMFILVPLGLWLIGGGVAFWKGRKSPFLAYIAGSDNRLSLSRLQTFAWTLVIFGTFAAAMGVHTRIIPGTKAEIEEATQAKDVADKAALQTAADAKQAAADARIAANALEAARKTAEEQTAATTATETARNAAVGAVRAATEAADKANKRQLDAGRAAEKASSDKRAADAKASSYEWVRIPAELLALAGIAIGSGIFSSLISASNSEGKTACVTSIRTITKADLRELLPKAGVPVNPNQIIIEGHSMGTTGKVRLDREVAPILNWNSEGSEIVIDVPGDKSYRTLVVETSNGKLSYELGNRTPNLTLGGAKLNYEFIDLFRDDKYPNILDTMKFQMFGWTLIAILIYVYIFLNSLTQLMPELPAVPSSIVVLTGLSQGGYLAGKAVGNVNKTS